MTVDLPLVQIYFSPQPSTAIKIKEGGHNFRYEITEHSLAKITPALQATRVNPLGKFSRQPLVLELDFHVFPYFFYIAHFTIDTWKSLLMEKSKAEESPWRKKGNKRKENRPKEERKSTKNFSVKATGLAELHAGAQISNKEAAVKQRFAKHDVKASTSLDTKTLIIVSNSNFESCMSIRCLAPQHIFR